MQNKGFIILTFVIAALALVVGALNFFTKVSSGDLPDFKVYQTYRDVDKTVKDVARDYMKTQEVKDGISNATRDLTNIAEVFGVESRDELPMRIASIDTTWVDEPPTVASIDTSREVIPLIELFRGAKPSVQFTETKQKAGTTQIATTTTKKRPAVPKIF